VVFDGFADGRAARPDCAAKFGGDLRGASSIRAHEQLVTTLVDLFTGEALNESVFGATSRSL
jgi:hypothetical protein